MNRLSIFQNCQCFQYSGYFCRWEKISGVTTVEEVKAGYRAASLSMARLNKIGAKVDTQQNFKNVNSSKFYILYEVRGGVW